MSQQQEPQNTGVVVLLVGFDEPALHQLSGALQDHVREVRWLGQYLNAQQASFNSKAAVALHKKLVGTAHMVIVDMSEDFTENAMILMLANLLDKAVIAIGPNADSVAWVSVHSLATFETIAEAEGFLVSYLEDVGKEG